MIRLYAGFFKELEPRAKPLSMAQIIVAVAAQYKNVAEGITFLEGKAKDFKGTAEANALLVVAIADSHILAKSFDKAKESLSSIEAVVESSLGVDPLVHSTYYRSWARLYQAQSLAAEFYKSALLFLAYTPLESLDPLQRRDLAREIGLAGLIAEDIYGLGELLSHPIVESLRNDIDHSWVLDLCNAFNSGKIDTWNNLKTRHANHIRGNAALSESMARLEEKITILAFIELIWSKPADGRTLSFVDISRATHVPVDKVELLVMRSFALGLVKGEIDQVRAVVIVASVKPRVLSPDQIAEMQARVKAWAGHVQKTLVDIEGAAPELLG